MNCRDATDLILESLTGTTPPDRRRALLAHLDECSSCRREAAEMEESVGKLRAVGEPRLPDGHWAAFMGALERRIAQENAGWRRLVRFFRMSRIAWTTAAATSVAAVALAIIFLVQPFGRHNRAADEDAQADLSGFVTESVVQSMPSMTASLASWKAGFSAPDVSYELLPAGGK